MNLNGVDLRFESHSVLNCIVLLAVPAARLAAAKPIAAKPSVVVVDDDDDIDVSQSLVDIRSIIIIVIIK